MVSRRERGLLHDCTTSTINRFATLVNRQLSSLLTLTQPVLNPLARLLDDGPHHALRNGVEVLHLTANTSALFI